MKKILVLGTSHVGAIKVGIDHHQSLSGPQFDYLALGSGPNFDSFYVADRLIAFPESKAKQIENAYGFKAFVALDDYDAVLFVHGSCRLCLELYSSDRRIPLLSRQVVREIAFRIDVPLYQSLAQVLDPSKLIFLGAPLIASSTRKSRYKPQLPVIDTPEDMSRAQRLAALIRDVCRASIDDPLRPSILLPPPHLLERHQFNTLDVNMRGGLSIRGQSKNPDAQIALDPRHGNALYGQAMGRLVLDYIDKC